MNVFITGTAGFIGFHIAKLLLEEGHNVYGFDGLTDYYDVKLKAARHEVLSKYSSFQAEIALLEDESSVRQAIEKAEPEIIIHLAAQAGVRYSLDNPRAYIDANIIGTFNILEGARQAKVRHLLMASTSSVYGANEEMPYKESDKADTQMSFYAATKKANEAMGHSYAHLHKIPITMFRFFTVYGPWGRPDMALYKFTKAILKNEPIDIYNHGDMYRDFTYVEDLVRAIRLLMDAPPEEGVSKTRHDSISQVAPYRVINIGNSTKVRLTDFVETLEIHLNRKAKKVFKEMQPGDVPATWASAELLAELTGYSPKTNIEVGVKKFVDWYLDFYELEK